MLHKIVKKDCIDAATFDVRTQADLLSMLIDNLDMLERVVYQIKAMLKEPNQENFETLKLQTVERLNASQQELNPSQKITKEEVQEGEPHVQSAAEVPAEPTENTEVKEWLFVYK